VIPRGRDNLVAIQMPCNHIKSKLVEGGNVGPVFYRSNSAKCPPSVPGNVLVADGSSEIEDAVDALHSEEVQGERLLSVITVLCNKLLTLCLRDFMQRRFFTPCATPRPLELPEAATEVKTEEEPRNEEPEIIVLDEEDDDGADSDIAAAVSNLTVFDIAEEMDGAMNGARQSLDGNQVVPLDFTPTASPRHGLDVAVVTIFSGGMLFGETIMEQMGNNKSFHVEWGSIHIFHESKKPAKPRFYDRQLPLNIHEQKVIMVDAFIGTGNRARMAIQVVIDHHVPQQNICFITLESTARGIINLAKVFPNVQFITARMGHSENDKHLSRHECASSLVIRYCEAAGIDIVEEE